jgi:hypothetical protein
MVDPDFEGIGMEIKLLFTVENDVLKRVECDLLLTKSRNQFLALNFSDVFINAASINRDWIKPTNGQHYGLAGAMPATGFGQRAKELYFYFSNGSYVIFFPEFIKEHLNGSPWSHGV